MKGGIKMIWNKSDFSEERFRGSPEDQGLHKRTFLKVIAFACLGMGPFLNACAIMSGGDTNQEPAKKKGGSDGTVLTAARPPIDLAAPVKIETATFALG
jgi:hypothetical protein